MSDSPIESTKAEETPCRHEKDGHSVTFKYHGEGRSTYYDEYFCNHCRKPFTRTGRIVSGNP